MLAQILDRQARGVILVARADAVVVALAVADALLDEYVDETLAAAQRLDVRSPGLRAACSSRLRAALRRSRRWFRRARAWVERRQTVLTFPREGEVQGVRSRRLACGFTVLELLEHARHTLERFNADQSEFLELPMQSWHPLCRHAMHLGLQSPESTR